MIAGSDPDARVHICLNSRDRVRGGGKTDAAVVFQIVGDALCLAVRIGYVPDLRWSRRMLLRGDQQAFAIVRPDQASNQSPTRMQGLRFSSRNIVCFKMCTQTLRVIVD